jgi:diadenosine tetraphosphate (Ap4A) HIT family hydrolase
MKCIFCDFVSKKRRKHDNFTIYGKEKSTKIRKSYDVISLAENKETFSFLTPPDNKGESHILVIPKKHYEFLEEIPKKILSFLIEEVRRIVGIVRKNYGDCHVLLNNGKNAEQWVRHVHFHIIPKNKDKKIIWKNLNPKQHKKISEELQKSQRLKTSKGLNN